MMFLLIMNLALVCIKRNFLASLIFTVTTFECRLLNTPLLKRQDLVHSASRAVDLLPGRPDRAYVASRIVLLSLFDVDGRDGAVIVFPCRLSSHLQL